MARKAPLPPPENPETVDLPWPGDWTDGSELEKESPPFKKVEPWWCLKHKLPTNTKAFIKPSENATPIVFPDGFNFEKHGLAGD